MILKEKPRRSGGAGRVLYGLIFTMKCFPTPVRPGVQLARMTGFHGSFDRSRRWTKPWLMKKLKGIDYHSVIVSAIKWAIVIAYTGSVFDVRWTGKISATASPRTLWVMPMGTLS
jgi:hypothetical protein